MKNDGDSEDAQMHLRAACAPHFGVFAHVVRVLHRPSASRRLYAMLATILIAATLAQNSSLVTETPSPLEQFKALKGVWDADIDGDAKPDTTIEYRIVGAGSAVVETLFGGTDHEMVTVYHMNGKELMCTHYCAAGNQPRLVAARISKDSVVFEMKDITNLANDKATHMHAVTFTFNADGTVRAVWQSMSDGKPGQTADFRMKRRN